MSVPISLWSLAILTLFGRRYAEAAVEAVHEGAVQPRFKHEAVPIFHRRQIPGPFAESSTTETSATVLTYVTPSPSASPIPITSQSQVVESYVPIVTFCAQPPLAYISGSFTNTASSGPPYLNYSVSTPSGSGACETSYSPTQTPICATTLTALASKATITACDQNVTFSTDYGYTIDATANGTSTNATVTPTPSVRTITTYYLAPWQDLAATPGVPPQDVDKKICTTFANGTRTCVVEYEEWHVVIATITTTTTSHVDVTATYPGPGQILVHTAHWDVTDTITTFALNTTMELESYTETESISQGPRNSSAATSSPNTKTLTVFYNSESL